MGNVCCTDKSAHSRGKVNVTFLKRKRKGTEDDKESILSRRRSTIAPNMKNFKSLKYIDNITDIYDIKEKLGQGSFGSVNKAVRKGGSNEVAIKIIDKKSLDNNPMLP